MYLIFEHEVNDNDTLVAKKNKKYNVKNIRLVNGKQNYSFIAEDNKETYVYKCDNFKFKLEG